MKIKTQLTLLFVLFGLTLSQAQTMVSGTVLGKDGQPIPGATVIVQETDNGVISDFDGQFSIGVENGQNIEVSYIGFGTQIIKFTGQDTLSVTLVQDFTQLDEIVVTGYGTRKRSQLTGAVAKIGGLGGEHDWIEIRLADVILLYAEALNENGVAADTVLALLDPIRTRAGLTSLIGTASSQADVKQAIAKERRLELAFEGHRWFDLVRTGTVDAEMGQTVNSNYHLFPIPMSEILATNSVITQNPGY
jgi:hypothetical protein